MVQCFQAVCTHKGVPFRFTLTCCTMTPKRSKHCCKLPIECAVCCLVTSLCWVWRLLSRIIVFSPIQWKAGCILRQLLSPIAAGRDGCERCFLSFRSLRRSCSALRVRRRRRAAKVCRTCAATRVPSWSRSPNSIQTCFSSVLFNFF